MVSFTRVAIPRVLAVPASGVWVVTYVRPHRFCIPLWNSHAEGEEG
jgi:hypothetical protein